MTFVKIVVGYDKVCMFQEPADAAAEIEVEQEATKENSNRK